MPPNDEAAPGRGRPVDAPDELNNPESTSLVQALDRIAAEMAEQRESLQDIACSLDYVVGEMTPIGVTSAMSCRCDCHDPGSYWAAYLYDDDDAWVGCIDCSCPERTAAEEAALISAVTKLAEAMEQRGARTVGELGLVSNLDTRIGVDDDEAVTS